MKKQDSGSKPKLSAKGTVEASPALKELFKDGICDLYWAENHLVKNLPKMIAGATSSAFTANGPYTVGATTVTVSGRSLRY